MDWLPDIYSQYKLDFTLALYSKHGKDRSMW